MARMNGEAAAASNIINPLLLESARVGSWEALDVFFQREDAQDPPMMIPTQEILALLARAQGRIAVADTPDLELGVYRQPASLAAGQLLQGVTPIGDTALHAVASNGDRKDFLKCASMVYGRDRGLLYAKNHNGDTPLHCATRAGNSKMVSLLIDLAGRESPDGKLSLLRMENKRQETALHEAVRIEDGRILGPEDREALFDADGTPEEIKIGVFVEQQGMTIVKKLMGPDPRLADYPVGGISPLYLAILLEKSTIAPTLYHLSGGNLSYSGADGQNALHVAILRDKNKVMIELLLHWNKGLTAQVDKDGSTPLHFVSPMYFWSGSYLLIEPFDRPPWRRLVWFPWRYTRALPMVFKVNPAALYQADKDGFFPIHVAAGVGAIGVIRFFLQQHPDIAGLRDAKGKTFLHVAIENRRLGIVSYACRNPSLAWILNMQDNDGNTALHLAIHALNIRMFCALLGNRKVNLDLANNQGETPYDVSRSKIPRGLAYTGNSENKIYCALRSVGAKHGPLRWDKTKEKFRYRLKPEDKDRESERLKVATQTLTVASVLIATMAFTATFAIPGGYRADDHTNGGTPTLAGRYSFDAFMIATTLAFSCSSLATVGFMFAGIPMVNLTTRRIEFNVSLVFTSSSVTCMFVAFALGVYMVLAPVAPTTAVAICVIGPVVLVGKCTVFPFNSVVLARPLFIRKGLFPGMMQLLGWNKYKLAMILWPFVVIFGWGGLTRIPMVSFFS